MLSVGAGPPAGAQVCSARGCRAPATHGLLWNNPKLHDPARRKVWTACPEHVESLGSFLAARGFLRATVPLDDVPAAVEAAGQQGDSQE